MRRPEHTAAFLRECLSYDPDTGELRWLVRPERHFVDKPNRKKSHVCALWNGRFAGNAAGSITLMGYLEIGIDGERYLAHRLIWAWMTGQWPRDEIDHVDLNRMNNAFSNLRAATSSENKSNRRKQSNNTSGFKGVSWYKAGAKWRADIMKDGRYKFLGYFAEKSEAVDRYNQAAKKLHGQFARVS